MPDDTKLSPGSVALSAGLSILALLFYALQVATLADLAGSDAAGNAYAQAYGAVEIIFLWALLAVLMLIAFLKGAVPKPAVLAAVILVPVSGVVAFAALDLLSKPYLSPFRWPLVLLVLMPPLIVAYCFWALLPGLHAKFPAHVTGGVIWGAVLTLCVAVVPLQQMREHALDAIDQELARYDEDYAKLAADAPLKDWLPFLETRNETKKNEVLGRMRKLEPRQSEAELMLERGDFPLRYLGSLDLTPTASICDKARALLRRQVEPLVLQSPNSKRYAEIAEAVSNALISMKWLVGYECSCDAESLAWETMAKAYRDTNFDVYELAELRDPKNFGRIVRRYPERFSMLTPRAHLKAWLTYADKNEFHDQALAGARKLDHRTADAVEMLNDKYDIAAPWQVLKYLPVLDLEMTPPLCGAALTQVSGDFKKVYRPKADDPPRPYSELLERLGAYDPLTALIWVAGHGCEAEPELTDAEAMVRTYQDTRGRAAMLATLAQLHRKN